MGKGTKVKKTAIISLSPSKNSDMIVTSIEQICPLDREWLEQCQCLRGAESLAAMVWVALQMGLWLARGVLEAELKRRSNGQSVRSVGGKCNQKAGAHVKWKRWWEKSAESEE
jgi:hypothetical protein